MIADIQKYDAPVHPVIYQDEWWTVYAEDKPFGILFHCYVHKWNKTAYEKIFSTWIDIISNTPVPAYVIAPNEKCRKFCYKLGFFDVDTVHDREGNFKGTFMEFVGEIE